MPNSSATPPALTDAPTGYTDWLAEYQLVEALPVEVQTSLPSIVQIERELDGEGSRA